MLFARNIYDFFSDTAELYCTKGVGNKRGRYIYAIFSKGRAVGSRKVNIRSTNRPCTISATKVPTALTPTAQTPSAR